MKEEWLFPEAVVPVDAETTAALVAEIHRLIDVVGGMALAQPDAFEQPKRQWVSLTEWEREAIAVECGAMSADWLVFMEAVERALKEKNS